MQRFARTLTATLFVVFAATAQAQSDDCALAPPIAGTGVFFANNIGATDSGSLASCNDAGGASRDAWFRWTSGAQTEYTFSACSPTFDIVLALWDACDGVELACSGTATCAPGGAEFQALNLTPFTEYWIQIDGRQGAMGSSNLTIALPSVPPNDTCTGATPIAGVGTFPVSNVSATSSFIGASCQPGTLDKDVYFAWTTGAVTDYVIRACGQGFTPLFALYPGCVGTEIGCGYAGGCSIGGSGTELILTGLQPNTTYILQVASFGGLSFDGEFEIIEYALPPNDTCATATPISGTGTFLFDSSYATDTAISWCTSFQVRDVWFAWTTGSATNYRFDADGMGYGVNMILRPGCGMNPIACTGNDELVATGLSPNTTYYLQVEGTMGTIDITSAPSPTNDDCVNATPISGLGSFPFDSTFATSGGPAATCNFNPFGNVDVWFQWTSGSQTDYGFGVCGNEFDVGIALWDACGGVQLDCSSNGGCSTSNTSAQLDVSGLTPNTTYWIQIDAPGWGDVGVLDVTPAGGIGPIGTPYCVSLTNSSGNAATLEALGSTSVSGNFLRLEATGLPSGVIGIFYYGTNQTQVPFGNGIRCVSGVVQRLPFDMADSAGMLLEANVYTLAMPNLQIAPGTLNFQSWFRDPNGGGFGFNLSDGVSITFTP